jgi:hypothetical protein
LRGNNGKVNYYFMVSGSFIGDSSGFDVYGGLLKTDKKLEKLKKRVII